MAIVWITGLRPRASVRSITHLIQQHTGMGLPQARRLTDRIVEEPDEPLRIEMDDEYAAYDMVSVLEDLGAMAEVEVEG